MEASERIYMLMAERGITPYALAKKIGSHTSTITKWKNAPTSNIGGNIIIAISNYLGVSCDYLLRGEQTPADEAARKAAGSLLPYRELVDAYRRADAKSKSIVRSALDLPPEMEK